MLLPLVGLLSAASAQQAPSTWDHADSSHVSDVAVTRYEVEEIMTGTAIGFFMRNITVVQSCIGGFDSVLPGFSEAFGLFEHGSVLDTLLALMRLTDALSGLSDAVANCGGTAEEVARVVRVMELLKNPKDFLFNAGQNLVIEGAEIRYHLGAAAKFWYLHSFRQFGYELGIAMNRVACGKMCEGPRSEDMFVPVKNLGLQGEFDIMKGVAQGFFIGHVNLEVFCAKDIDGIEFHVNAAIEHFLKHTEDEIMKGLEELGVAMVFVTNALGMCGAEKEHLIRLEKAIELLRHPQEFWYEIEKHIFVEKKDIFFELKAAKIDWANHQFENFGFQVGLILSQILTGTPEIYDVLIA